MGRAERRRQGNKAPVRTYTLTDAEILKIKREASQMAYDKIMETAETEIKRQILEKDKELSADLDAAILWVLHDQLGFGKARLRRFWEAFILEHKFLRAVWGDGNVPAKFREYLLQIGVDVDAWNEELEKEDE